MLVKLFSFIALIVFIALMINGAALMFAFIRSVAMFIILIFLYQVFAFMARAISKNNNKQPKTKEDVTN
ncbi:MAG TPA: hypothetical protein VJ991_15755 [Balneolales bacterium]|nr:hypothetical protein [Balneolales bacterium]